MGLSLRNLGHARLIKPAARQPSCPKWRTAPTLAPRLTCAAAPQGGSSVAPSIIAPTVITDEAVPEGHKGLHGFLYGEDGDAHGTGSLSEYRQGEDDGTRLLPVSSYVQNREGEKPVGVYAIYDAAQAVQYVGFSRNIVLSVKGHQSKVGGARCAYVRAKTFLDKAIHSRANLEREAEQWLAELPAPPPGNGPEAALWSGAATPAVAVMSEAEKEKHEELKLKMQKAMGAVLDIKEVEAKAGSEEWRTAMKAAVEGSDWSAVISEQTNLTIDPSHQGSTNDAPAPTLPPSAAAAVAKAEAAAAERAVERAAKSAARQNAGSTGAAAPANEAVISPFTTEAAQRDVQGEGRGQAEALTVEAVNAALDEVRPYLVADGGDVEVVGVAGGVVMLQLQGACSSCPSQGSTMKMGIESTLKRRFGDLIQDIIQVNPLPPGATVEAVDNALNALRGAVSSYGGSVEVLKVEGGVCELRYVGPAPIGKGLIGAVKEQFPDIKEVLLL